MSVNQSNMTKVRRKLVGLNFGSAERPVVELLKFLQDNPTDQGEGFLIEIGEKWKEVVAATRQLGGKGTMTLKFTIAAEGKRVGFVGDYSTTKPKAKRKGMLGYADEAGNLSLSDPDQAELNLGLDDQEEA